MVGNDVTLKMASTHWTLNTAVKGQEFIGLFISNKQEPLCRHPLTILCLFFNYYEIEFRPWTVIHPSSLPLVFEKSTSCPPSTLQPTRGYTPTHKLFLDILNLILVLFSYTLTTEPVQIYGNYFFLNIHKGSGGCHHVMCCDVTHRTQNSEEGGNWEKRKNTWVPLGYLHLTIGNYQSPIRRYVHLTCTCM